MHKLHSFESEYSDIYIPPVSRTSAEISPNCPTSDRGARPEMWWMWICRVSGLIF